MDARDLMINNYVQLPCGSIVQVKEISFIDENDEWIMFYPRINDSESIVLNDVRPIIINDYWLNYFKFECIESVKKSITDIVYIHKEWILHDWFLLEKEDQDIDAENIGVISEDDTSYDVSINNKYITCISHVHQLQNLYKLLSYREQLI